MSYPTCVEQSWQLIELQPQLRQLKPFVVPKNMDRLDEVPKLRMVSWNLHVLLFGGDQLLSENITIDA